MGAVDFEEWVAPTLDITLGGRTYRVQPPSVENAGKLLAAAIRGEVNLGLVKGEIPVEVQHVLDTIQPGEHPALGDAYRQMAEDGISGQTLDRVAYYAIFYWARSKEYADFVATVLWTPRAVDAVESAGTGPKG
ncbi:hypothetical protein EDF35_1938 [Rathayibacter sp. PhB151]|uniref:DUF7426 family protein n=1 Tax=Rathayibacter sp. PhB151 TaxID=2485189 RepID=UPI0010636DA4|nr:hypothetical protein [Rathayibacter sp. PhB151]TDX78724.1 hypothetical protein EDF35_1938 [Rathayibacter sp. PhB151]